MFRVYHASLELLTPKQGVTLRFAIIPLMRYIAYRNFPGSSRHVPSKLNCKPISNALSRRLLPSSTIALLKSRLTKIIELQKLRNYNCEGNRELMSFVFYNTAVQVYPHEIAQQKLSSFNNNFINPLNVSELNGITKSVDTVTNMRGEQGYYLIGANRLRELLAMTLKEEVAINFFESKRLVMRKRS